VINGDPNTGIQQIGGADTFSIVTAGSERLRIGTDGNIGINTASTSTAKAAVGGTISGTGANFIILATVTAQSPVTTLNGYYTQPSVASDCTLSSLAHFAASQGTISGTVSSQVGFYVISSLTGGANNFGFRADLTSGTGRWNFYAHGNAQNYFAGNVGIGASRTAPATALDVNGDVTITDKIIHSGDTNTAIRFADNDTVTVETAGSERVRVDSSGNVGIHTTSPTAKLDISGDTLRLRTARTPASAGAAGNAGDICWDADYLYVCTATNTWRRIAHSTW
jgi:hypothetical protein